MLAIVQPTWTDGGGSRLSPFCSCSVLYASERRVNTEVPRGRWVLHPTRTPRGERDQEASDCQLV